MTDQNHRTIDSYNRAFEKYLATMRPAPAEHVKAWLDKAIDGHRILAFEVDRAERARHTSRAWSCGAM